MQNHQQALLVVLSYIIGFITAFIMFGLADDKQNEQKDNPTVFPEETVEIREKGEQPRVYETEEGLFVSYAGQERILSALTKETSAVAGFHVDILNAILSPDWGFVLYCAQMEASKDECQYFVYSLADDTTHMIKFEDGSPLVTTNDSVNRVLWSPYETPSVFLDGQDLAGAPDWILPR